VILNGFFISPAQSVILKKRPSGGFDSYGHSWKTLFDGW
jgi:hypothetical protein